MASGGFEAVAGAVQIRLHGVEFGRGHLACHEPCPDQLVEFILIGGENAFDGIGMQRGIDRTDGLMRILSARFGFVYSAAVGEGLLPHALGDIGNGGGVCLV